MCSLNKRKWQKCAWRTNTPPPPPCVSKMAVIFYRLNSEEIRFFAPKDCNLLLIQIIFPLENKSSSIGIQKYRTNQLEYILLIKHWKLLKTSERGALAPAPWFLSLQVPNCVHQEGPFLWGYLPKCWKKHKCYKSSMNIDNFSPFSNVWIFGE